MNPKFLTKEDITEAARTTAKEVFMNEAKEQMKGKPEAMIEKAIEEASTEFQHSYVGTEHILLGLIAGELTVASTVLSQLDVTRKKVVAAIREILGHKAEPKEATFSFVVTNDSLRWQKLEQRVAALEALLLPQPNPLVLFR